MSIELPSGGIHSATPPSLVGAIAEGSIDPKVLSTSTVSFLVRNGLAGELAALVDEADLERAAARVLNQGAHAAFIRGMKAASAAIQATAMLADQGVPGLVYKGPALAVETTGTFTRRGSADVDILVASATLPDVHTAFTRAGLSRSDGRETPPGFWLRYRECERSYVGLPSTIDLHWRVDSPGYFRCSFAELWSRRTTVDISGDVVATLDTIDALLATAVHGTRERWSQWKWVLDSYRQLAALGPEEWVEARNRALRIGASRSLAMSVAVALHAGLYRDWLPTPAPKVMMIAGEWLLAPRKSTSDEASAALARRAGRWWAADSHTAAADAALRALARQLLGESRTFRFR